MIIVDFTVCGGSRFDCFHVSACPGVITTTALKATGLFLSVFTTTVFLVRTVQAALQTENDR